MNHSLSVSLIATVYNEGASIRTLLDSLLQQTRLPDEVVICDGGSSDDTVAQIEAYRDRLPDLRVIVEPGANISRGRNVAIAAANGPIIAATDAGVRLDERWLEKLVEPFEDGGEVARWQSGRMAGGKVAVAGFFVPEYQGVFQTAMAATVLPLSWEIDPDKFLPSSRSVAFPKAAWAQTGGYPEWLDYCEDLLFDFAINEQVPEQSSGFHFVPGAKVYFRPRTSLRAFWTQYYLYARGDGKANLWLKRHAARYFTYGVLLPALLGHALFGRFAKWLGWLGLIAGVVAYCWRPWQRLDEIGVALDPNEKKRAVLLVPIIRAVGDIAKMAGYPAGVRWRAKRANSSTFDAANKTNIQKAT